MSITISSKVLGKYLAMIGFTLVIVYILLQFLWLIGLGLMLLGLILYAGGKD